MIDLIVNGIFSSICFVFIFFIFGLILCLPLILLVINDLLEKFTLNHPYICIVLVSLLLFIVSIIL